MVHMEKVEVYGFKSFGFRNTAIKLSPGLVSISGPNGSGKSSILDAIAFALGEKSPRILRVPSLKGVINDQEGSRSSTKIARASVHLDNVDRAIPMDSDRVEITRIIDESGESSYYINKKKTTRSRIRDMLDAANATLNVFNHVQQGYIQRISEMGSDERQRTVEDLVGLSYFDEKKGEAVSQLDNADRRLEVALAKMGDVRGRIGELEEERNQVIRHQTLRQELDRYTAIRSLQNLRELRQSARSLEEQAEQVSAQLAENEGRQQKAQSDIQSLVAKRKSHMDEADAYGRNRADIASAIASAVEGVQNAATDLKLAEKRILDTDRRIGEARAGIIQIISDRRALRPRMESCRNAIREASARLKEVSGALEEVNGRRARTLQWQSQVASQKARAEAVLKLFHDALRTQERLLYDAESAMSGNSQSVEADGAREAALQQSLSGMKEVRDRLESWMGRTDAVMDSTSKRLEEMRRSKARLDSEAQIIDNLVGSADKVADRYDSKLRLARKVMHEDYSVGRLRADAPRLGVLGLACELLFWDKRYERAVMAAASDWLKAVVVEDAPTMLAVSSVVGKMNLPRVRMIPRAAIPKMEPAPDSLAARISCSSSMVPVRNLLFADTILCDSPEQARREARAGRRAVTLQGQCVGPDGSLVLDRASAVSDLTRMISVSTDIEGLQMSVERLRAMRKSRARKLRRTADAMSKDSAKLSRVRESRAAAAQQLADLELRINHASKALGDVGLRLRQNREKMPAMARRHGRLSKLVARIRGLIEREEARVPPDASARIAARMESLNRHKSDFERLQSAAAAKNSQIRAQWQALVSQSDILMQRAASYAGEQASLMRENGAARKSLAPLQQTLSDKSSLAESLRKREQHTIQASGEYMQRIKEYDRLLEPLRQREKGLGANAASLQRRRDSLKRDLADCQNRIVQITDTLPSRPPSNVPDGDPAPMIEALRAELDSVPPLNANAPSSYASVSTGYRSMSDRKNVLEGERNKIVEFIEGVDRDKRQTYLDAFDVVDTEIRSIFGRMSGGGAWLELEDEDNVFESGINYLVQFPGKQKRMSTALSGGEKTLAAIVFVLALQKLKPSPFYLFDEADAHLDATNSERLANILAERSQNSQFVMVSLKEFVVQKASLIYGVYPKNGISQVVSYRDSRARPVSN